MKRPPFQSPRRPRAVSDLSDHRRALFDTTCDVEHEVGKAKASHCNQVLLLRDPSPFVNATAD